MRRTERDLQIALPVFEWCRNKHSKKVRVLLESNFNISVSSDTKHGSGGEDKVHSPPPSAPGSSFLCFQGKWPISLLSLH